VRGSLASFYSIYIKYRLYLITREYFKLVLDELINKIENVTLRKKVSCILNRKDLFIEVEHKAMDLRDAPASIRHHHSYRRGLLDHIKSTAKVVLVLCDTIEKVYHGKIIETTLLQVYCFTTYLNS